MWLKLKWISWFQPQWSSASGSVSAAALLASPVFSLSPGSCLQPVSARELARPWLVSDQIHLDLGLHCLAHEDGRPALCFRLSACRWNAFRFQPQMASGMNPFWRRMRHKLCLQYPQTWSQQAAISVRGDSAEPLSQKRLYHEVSFKDDIFIGLPAINFLSF